MKRLRGRQNSFKNFTQFSQWNNVVDSPASQIDGFLEEKQWLFYSVEGSNVEQC
jgi:hypothetical protein